MPTRQDLIDIILDVSGDIAKLETHEQKKIINSLKKMEKELLESLQKINPTSSKTAAKRTAKTREALAQSKIITEKYYQDIQNYHQQELQELAKFNNRHMANSINNLYGVDKITTLMSASQLKSMVKNEIIMGEKLSEFWSRQSADVVRKYRNEIQLGLLSNDTFNQLERRIRGTREMKYRDGIMQVPNNQARTYIRTSIQNISNSARMQTYQDNTDVIEAMEWLSTLDMKTSLICQMLDRKKWSLPDYNPIDHSQPFPGVIAHPNCRSTQLPVIKGIDSSDGTRASMYGPVSGDVSYRDWLKNPPERMLEEAGKQAKLDRPMTATEFQNMKLGTWKAKQFRRGELSLSDLISPKTKDGTPIIYTMDDLKAKHGLSDKVKNDIIVDSKQFGKKYGKHAVDFGFDVKSNNDRRTFRAYIEDIFELPDEVTYSDWKSQKNPVEFYIKGEHVVVVNAKTKEFISILEGGVKNVRVKSSRERK